MKSAMNITPNGINKAPKTTQNTPDTSPPFFAVYRLEHSIPETARPDEDGKKRPGKTLTRSPPIWRGRVATSRSLARDRYERRINRSVSARMRDRVTADLDTML
jgi:hypothetical protein